MSELEKIKYLKENIYKIITAVPICLLAIGSLIIESYLARYGIVELPTFNSRLIFIGVIGCFIILSFILLWFLFFDFCDTKFCILKLLYNTFYKACFSTYLFIEFLLRNNKIEIKNFETSNYIYNSGILLNVSSLLIVSFGIETFPRKLITGDGFKWKKLLTRFVTSIAMIGIVAFIILEKNIKEINQVFNFYLTMSVLLSFFAMFYWNSKDDGKKRC